MQSQTSEFPGHFYRGGGGGFQYYWAIFLWVRKIFPGGVGTFFNASGLFFAVEWQICPDPFVRGLWGGKLLQVFVWGRKMSKYFCRDV